MRRWWPLTGRGTGALLLAVACFVAADRVGLAELQWFGVLLATVVAGCLLWVHASRRRAEVTRTLSPEAPPTGDELHVQVRVRMTSAAGSPAGHWHDEVPAGLAGPASGPFPAVVGGWSSADRVVTVAYTLHARTRGVRVIGPFTVTVVDPFGIARRTAELGDLTRVVVTPAPVELAATGGLRGRSGGAQPTPSNRFGQGSDDLVARPWAPGDSMRRIHWRASAHRDELMVRQEERETSPEARVVLDRAVERFSAEAGLATGADDRFETAVVACASAVTRLVRDGFTVDVVDAGGMPLCDPVAGGDETGLHAMQTALAEVRARTTGPLTPSGLGLSGDPRGPVVLVTGRLTEADAAALAPAASHTVLPVLLAFGSDAGTLGAARGWQARAVRDTEGLAGAWADILSEEARHAVR